VRAAAWSGLYRSTRIARNPQARRRNFNPLRNDLLDD
jgi:hypothetical protein